jgi:hypothetical protein
MMNDRNNPYWANPADDNGRLQTSNLRRVLQFFVGSNGSALTGKTGRSTSDIPYAWSDPNGTKGQTVVAKQGREHRRLRAIRFLDDQQLQLHRRQFPERRQRRRPPSASG